jgi:HEAT repeat protein
VPTASELVQRLGSFGSDLPNAVTTKIVALGREEVTPLLLRLLDESGDGTDTEAPSRGDDCAECGDQHEHREWARFHAVDLLAQLHEPAAIEPMLKVLERTPSDQPLHDKIIERLPDFGGAALDLVVAALARIPKEAETAESLCCILSALGVRDARILQALTDLLKVHPRAAAMYLGDYGDPAACPALLAVIAAAEPDVEDSAERLAFFDLLDVYASLGGALPADVKARIDAWLGAGSAS